MFINLVNIASLGESLLNAGRSQNYIVYIAGIVFSLLTLFFGYQIIKIWIGIVGFIIGATLAIITTTNLSAPYWAVIAAAIVVGALLAIASFSLYKMGIFLFVAFTTYIAVTNLLSSLTHLNATWWLIVIGLVIGIAFGILAVRFVRLAVIISSALSASATLSVIFAAAINTISFPIVLFFTAVLTATGITTQFRTTTNRG